MKNIFLVGNRKSINLIRYINKRDDLSLNFFVDKNKDFKTTKSIKQAQIFKVDFSSKESLFKSLKELSEIKVDALISRYEDYVIQKAWIAKFYDIPSQSIESAIACRDKYIMRKRFLDYDPSITPQFNKVNSFDDIQEFISDKTFPYILKPSNLAKSLFITKNYSISELRENYENMVKGIKKYKKQSKYDDLETDIIIEEFIEGKQYTVQCFTDNYSNTITTPIVSIKTAKDIGFNDTFLFSRTSPASLEKNQEEIITNTAIKGMKALNMKSGTGHVELIYDKSKGGKIIEIGSRIGGYRTRMYRMSANLDLNDVEIKVQDPEFKFKNKKLSKAHNHCGVFEIFPDKEAKFVKIKKEGKIRDLKGLEYFKIKNKPGDKIGPAKKGYKASAIIILNNKDKDTFKENVDFIENEVEVKYE